MKFTYLKCKKKKKIFFFITLNLKELIKILLTIFSNASHCIKNVNFSKSVQIWGKRKQETKDKIRNISYQNFKVKECVTNEGMCQLSVQWSWAQLYATTKQHLSVSQLLASWRHGSVPNLKMNFTIWPAWQVEATWNQQFMTIPTEIQLHCII